MRQIPLKRCPVCGLYHDIAQEQCTCGADLRKVPGLIPGPDEQIRPGRIDEQLPLYVQVCSSNGCGAENFTADPEKRVKICYRCGRGRVALVSPVPYEPKDPAAEASAAPAQAAERPAAIRSSLQTGPAGTVPAAPAARPREERDEDILRWEKISAGLREQAGKGRREPTASQGSESPAASAIV